MIFVRNQNGMTTYETITSQQQNILNLMSIGVVPVQILDWKVYYEAYLKELALVKKTEAVATIAAQYDISKRHMFRIIDFMERLT